MTIAIADVPTAHGAESVPQRLDPSCRRSAAHLDRFARREALSAWKVAA